jgi:hypothetical protein
MVRKFISGKGNYGEPDFLLITESEKIVIDTKYKQLYQDNENVMGVIILMI